MDVTVPPLPVARRDVLRAFPLVPVFVFAGLSVATTWAYLTGVDAILPCRTPGACAELRVSWLAIAALFGGCFAAVAALFEVDARRSRTGGALRILPKSVLLMGFGLAVLGVVGLVIQQGESYGRSPQGSGAAIWVAYVTASLLLFALAFLGHRGSSRLLDRLGLVVAAVHSATGSVFAVYLAFWAVFPHVVVT